MIEKIFNHLSNGCNPDTTYVHRKDNTIDIVSTDFSDAMLMLIVVSEVTCLYFEKGVSNIHVIADLNYNNEQNTITLKIT